MHENDKYPGVPERIQLMDENGTVHEHPTFSRYVKDVDGDTLREAYRLMYTTRRFDDEATALQRQGQLALWVPSRGQEAAQVGSALAYAPNDYIFPSYREHAVALARGVDFRDLITIFRGTTTHGWDMKAHNFHTYTKVLAAQTLHAVGYAMGLNFDADIEAETGKRPTGQGQATDPATDAQKPAVAVYFGDGSSSEGDVHESMVFAASYDAPVLFFVQNNRWAISVPFEVQSRVPISTRAAGYGFEGLRVDGNDILGVLAATRYAMEKIRAGEGPVLIEAETYRLGPHTTADDPTKYRTEADLEGPLHRDPMIRLEKYLREQGYADDAFFEEVAESAQQVANGVREAVLNSEVADFEYFFDRVYVQEHQQVEDDREFYRNYVAGFEEE
ncbi:pyruvate dehydrogenase (acetyl-transferring) E1 component subunit alpha [Rothia mucilaginosa]|uniref:2-oxoisovalerate dehydrogenase subunit alpha n=1 Tax=Rothia mucilaginosa TaxID=43675 RepID=A0A291DFZ3_9MICC|nr:MULTISPECIES: thiamine pyrophosphate-dependent enzyme [Rothia]ATF63333.1 pyruvate dehydrogenase (acetyl-transferring) E1 component subunit alpha [Rothia mucilaginosa]OFM26993.1 pyruvate dehydrogenase (acetyl-transferring) E1 component subunit alpha [Rothia sp. HMSC069D01]